MVFDKCTCRLWFIERKNVTYRFEDYPSLINQHVSNLSIKGVKLFSKCICSDCSLIFTVFYLFPFNALALKCLDSSNLDLICSYASQLFFV